jgi:uncharacterized protein (TIGR00369 family)
VNATVLDQFNEAMAGTLPALLGIVLVDIGEGHAVARLDLEPSHLAPNEYLHAGTVVTLADSCAGMGCIASFPDHVGGFTTIELKTNFLRTAREGGLRCESTLLHGGGRTQVWDSVVTRERDDKAIALFRCTQFLLPKDDRRTTTQQRERERIEAVDAER